VTWTEHRTHQLRCRQCRARTSARLPEQIGVCVFGPRLEAAIVTLTARHRPRPVRRHDLDRQRGRDLPARLGRVGRPAPTATGRSARSGRGPCR
jgi:hypothetical protein